MPIKAVGFDIGKTLINYNAPLSWKSLYPNALLNVINICQLDGRDEKIASAVEILSKYNTRENYREYEVSSDTIFREIFDAWGQKHDKISTAKKAFYGFFQANAMCFDDTVSTLAALSAKKILLGYITDVAYGMDNIFALKDIAEIKNFFDAGFTSNDIGYRKPHARGFKMLLEALGVSPSEMLYVGDEEKDIVGANNVGITSVLINRSTDIKNFGQKHTVQSLGEILSLTARTPQKTCKTDTGFSRLS